MRVRSSSGFTVPELLAALVLLIAALLTAVVLLHPQTYTAENDAANRRIAMAQILQGIARYKAAEGHLPPGISITAKEIGQDNNQIDLCKDLVPQYAHDLGYDPLTGAKGLTDGSGATDKPCNSPDVLYVTGFTIQKDAAGHVTLHQALVGGGASGAMTMTL